MDSAARESFFGSIVYRFFNQPRDAGDAGYERTKQERRQYLKESHEAAFYHRTVAKEMKPRYAQGCDLFYHRMPVMGPHSWGGAAKTHLAYITQTAAKQYEEATE